MHCCGGLLDEYKQIEQAKRLLEAASEILPDKNEFEKTILDELIRGF